MYVPVLAPKLDELASPGEMPTRWEEFMKQWPGQWQSMVMRFVEKRTEMGRGEERGGEFLCPERGDVFRRSGNRSAIAGKLTGCGSLQLGSCAVA